jgi:hypothetical protein
MAKIICPFCGYRFDPNESNACRSCPLQRDCQLVCCPNCGYETIDVQRSKLVNFFTRLISREVDDQEEAT